MECWIFAHIPIENWIDRWISNYRTIFDAWEDGGVRGLVVGRLRIVREDGSYARAFAPDPRVYKALGVSPPEDGPVDPKKEKKLREILDNAAARGWPITTFDAPGGGSRPPEEDPYGEFRFAAAVQDLARAFPQVNGVIVDGPREQHYELAWHHGSELFQTRVKDGFEHLGYDLDRLERGIAHLRQRFHHLTPDMVRYHAPGGLLAGLILFDVNEDALYWLRARQEVGLGMAASLRQAIDRVDRKMELGLIPRITAFSSLTGQNYQQMAPHLDYIFPKHYYWHRGFDGLYGTVQRWVQKFVEWNPSLTEEDGFALVKSLFGLELPGIHSLLDMEMGFPDEFFSEVVHNQTRRALDAVGDDDKVIFWVSASSRRPHDGDAMPARDLHGILQATKDAGGKRFLFHPEPDINAPAWHVISRVCGNPWNEATSPYWPADTWREDIEGYGTFRSAQSKK